MVQILVGAAAGLLTAAAVMTGYWLGTKHGMGSLRMQSPKADGAVQQQDALMKKYEAILDYDPYGERV